jgi:thymidylate synthase
MTPTDQQYLNIISHITYLGLNVSTRNAATLSSFDVDPITFTSTPLVTLRKTAWKTALREMEWFMNGDSKCPEELLPWWKDQLTKDGYYFDGYAHQFRHFSAKESFDQIKFILNGLRTNPYSRRLIITTWNPYEMAHITETNSNPKTPTTCHSTLIQFFVRNESLHMTSYQRSADLLLGVSHNWIQSWALLLYFAHHSQLKVGSLRWIFGDSHIYSEESHLEAVKELLCHNMSMDLLEKNSFELKYQPTLTDEDIPKFLATDFVMDGVIPEPVTFIRPKLL